MQRNKGIRRMGERTAWRVDRALCILEKPCIVGPEFAGFVGGDYLVAAQESCQLIL